ncbi:hypothetical protein I4U23_013543 [Adineta vaga]|nr:hypothetical protein I4U23_013543 [Adineta vaga]
MSTSPRQIPMEITLWMEKDVKIEKLGERGSVMPTDTKQNAILNRKFFADMYNLSSERYRTINQCTLDKQNFLQQQQARAEIGMPGLLPYIAQSTPKTGRSLSSSILSLNKTDQSIVSSFQPTLSHSNAHTEIQKKNDKLQLIVPKARSKRQQESIDRINRLAQPRGRPYQSLDHVRSHYIPPITVKDLFGEIDDVSNVNTQLSDKSRSIMNDTRFQQLVETCSDVHTPENTTAHLKTVQNIVQSNPSLQDKEGRWQMTNKSQNRTVEFKKHLKKLSKEFSSTKHKHLVDLFIC